eukprot:gene10081-18731_t
MSIFDMLPVGYNRVDIVADTYREISPKDPEREKSRIADRVIITTLDVFVVEQLSSNQEEADTKLLLQPVHSLSENADASVVVRSSLLGDVDINILFLSGFLESPEKKCGCPDGLQRQQRVWIDAAFPEEVEQILAGEESNIESSDESKDEEFINSYTLLNWKPALIG